MRSGAVRRTMSPCAGILGRYPFSKRRSRSRSLSPACMRSCAHSRPLTGRPHPRVVRPALEAFYNALSDEQRARFNTLSPRLPAASEDQPQQEAKAESCGASKSSLTGLPIERIDAVLRPTGAQKGALDRLSAATKKAVHGLQAASPDEGPVTQVGRLQAMEKRRCAVM